MELKKGKYKSSEVEKMLQENSAEFQIKIYELKEKIVELSEENKKLSAENLLLKNEESLVSDALIKAQTKAKSVERKVDMQYAATLLMLRNFSNKWSEYFNYIKEKYPFYPATKQAVSLKEELDQILGKKNSKKTVEQLDSSLKKVNDVSNNTFDPKAKIQDYIAATSDNGFNLDEVLNPGELQLEDLCKELGLLEENE